MKAALKASCGMSWSGVEFRVERGGVGYGAGGVFGYWVEWNGMSGLVSVECLNLSWSGEEHSVECGGAQ